ncbi:hypothetical protein Daus18300_007083 [Diaporthe australafricana]|uniref:AT hook domain-containing protein n=1 Tax=Diaporthe australafricana TaxID=127596 RepID=A0ABR3WQH8_9PEZI
MALIPPVDKDGFSFAGDSLFREASNLNRHRRATVPELKAHFAGKDTENRPAHWYEAQLLHYGLPPSKVKGTAHKRLFDAVTGKGGLTVPAHIQKIEADLKKEWNKREREAKKVIKEADGRGTKRKADQVSTNVNVNVSVQVSSTGVVQVQTAQPSTKKPKIAKSGSAGTVASKKAASTTTTKEKKTATTTAKKAVTGTTTTGKAKKAPASKPEKGNPVSKPAKAVGKAPTPRKPAQRPRAPKSSAAQESGYTVGGSSGGYDDVPPPYSEVDPSYGPRSQPSPRRRLGLLNGRYEVDCPYIEGNFPGSQDDFGLIATLDGTKLWLKFDLGPVFGIMKVDRPYEVDEDEDGTMLFWRGESTVEQEYINIDTVARAGEANRLHFLGDGHIRGTIAYRWHVITFNAYRISGQSMTSEISPTEAREEWMR